MKQIKYNSEGVQTGPNGYIICGYCKQEVQEVSRETTIPYAYHVRCKPTLFGYADPQVRFQAFLQAKHATG